MHLLKLIKIKMIQTKRKRGRSSKKGSKTDILNNLDDNLKKINEISKSSQSNIKILNNSFNLIFD